MTNAFCVSVMVMVSQGTFCSFFNAGLVKYATLPVFVPLTWMVEVFQYDETKIIPGAILLLLKENRKSKLQQKKKTKWLIQVGWQWEIMGKYLFIRIINHFYHGNFSMKTIMYVLLIYRKNIISRRWIWEYWTITSKGSMNYCKTKI